MGRDMGRKCERLTLQEKHTDLFLYLDATFDATLMQWIWIQNPATGNSFQWKVNHEAVMQKNSV